MGPYANELGEWGLVAVNAGGEGRGETAIGKATAFATQNRVERISQETTGGGAEKRDRKTMGIKGERA